MVYEGWRRRIHSCANSSYCGADTGHVGKLTREIVHHIDPLHGIEAAEKPTGLPPQPPRMVARPCLPRCHSQAANRRCEVLDGFLAGASWAGLRVQCSTARSAKALRQTMPTGGKMERAERREHAG